MFPYFDLNYRQWLPEDKNASILDFGCGPGSLLLYLQSQGYRNVTGFDTDSRYAAYVKENVFPRTDFRPDGRTFLSEHAQTYDLIVCRHVAYYFPKAELQEWMQSLRSALKPGGRLILEVYNAAGIFGPWPLFNDPFIQIAFTDFLLTKTLGRAGFKIEGLFEGKSPGTGIRHWVWLQARRVWFQILKTIAVIERGVDANNPKLYGKNLIAVATQRTQS